MAKTEFRVVKDHRDGPFYHLQDPTDSNRALCGRSVIAQETMLPAWGQHDPLIGQEYCKTCEGAAADTPAPAKARRKASKGTKKKPR